MSIDRSGRWWTGTTAHEAECPCGAGVFDVAVGFSLSEGQDVRWLYVALRCRNDGVLGVYADWKIDYSPSEQLLGQV